MLNKLQRRQLVSTLTLMKRIKVGILSFALLLTGVQNSQADLKFSDCLLSASSRLMASLGKPLLKERLGNKMRIKVGVLPYYFKNHNKKILSESEKSDYSEAASLIHKLSNNKIEIQIVFFPSVRSELTSSEFSEIVRNVSKVQPYKDLAISTWGFAKTNVTEANKTLDFSNLDSIILEGSNEGRFQLIAEAMGFVRANQGYSFENANLDFFASIPIRGGFIDNAILIDRHPNVFTITHELLHNFGLIDLYETVNGPTTAPVGLSLMASINNLNLLNYEKAVLGWFPTENFKCTEFKDVMNESKVENQILIQNITQDSILLLKISNDKAYIIEIVNSGGKKRILFYLLEQEKRPAISILTDPVWGSEGVFDLSNPVSIGSAYHSDNFDVLVSNIISDEVELNLIPKKLFGTVEDYAIRAQSKINRNRAVENKSSGPSKAGVEEERKTVTDNDVAKKKAKQETEVKLPKLKTIFCAKGKIEKKITSSKPLCPSGYQKKLKSK